MARRFFLFISTLLLFGCGSSSDGLSDAPSHPARIIIDGDSQDWEAVDLRHADASNDGEALDLGRLWMAHDDRRVFFRLEVGTAINLQEGNDLRLLIDTDADSTTGTVDADLPGRIGAELVWTFGERSGLVETADGQTEITHEALGFASLPTVTSDVFELSLDRQARPGDQPLFDGDTFRIAVTGGGDRLPDVSALGYTLTSDPLPLNSAGSIERPEEAALRVVSYNVLFDRLFDAVTHDAYSRLFGALEADVYAFQEIYDTDAETTRQAVEELDPREDGTWHAAKAGLDLVVVSRYPILAHTAIPGFEDYESAAFLLDTEAVLGTPTLVLNAHPPCCNYPDADPSRDVQRQHVADRIAAFLRDVRRGTASIDVPEDTPILVAGDMNFVGDAQQPNTIASGTIVNAEAYGPSAAPDWDGSGLLDTNPRQTGAPLTATWMGEDSSYPPGRLDYMYVSDSVVKVVNRFVLRTDALDPPTRERLGLKIDDTSTASDHLPVVVDVAAP